MPGAGAVHPIIFIGRGAPPRNNANDTETRRASDEAVELLPMAAHLTISMHRDDELNALSP